MARGCSRHITDVPFVVVCLGLCLAARPAEAQPTQVRADPTGAVTNLFINGGGETEHYTGWLGAADFHGLRTTSFVVEASGDYSSDDDGDSYRIYTFVAGPKFTGLSGRVRPFFQIPVGGLLYSSHSGWSQRTYTNPLFVVKPGGGIDVPVSPHVSMRLAADWFVVEPWYAQAWVPRHMRFVTGVTYRQ